MVQAGAAETDMEGWTMKRAVNWLWNRADTIGIGDRVTYHGYRGDIGQGTVMRLRSGLVKVKRDFSADDGVWFRPSELTIKAKRPA